MVDQPLSPFPSPTYIPGFSSIAISQGFVVEWFCYIVFTFWAAYTAIAIYHWLKYSHASLIAIPSIVAHIGISFILISYILSGAYFI